MNKKIIVIGHPIDKGNELARALAELEDMLLPTLMEGTATSRQRDANDTSASTAFDELKESFEKLKQNSKQFKPRGVIPQKYKNKWQKKQKYKTKR